MYAFSNPPFKLFESSPCRGVMVFSIISLSTYFSCTKSTRTAALHVAAAEGHFDLVMSLLKLKADATLKDNFGNTPFKDAVQAKFDRIAALMRLENPGIKYILPGNELGRLMCKAAFDV